MSTAALRRDKERKAGTTQRRAAEPQASVWVAASAGTGKTKVLTDRVLSLMLHGTPPARILCLTFTKAAAAEMSNRLAERLAAWAAAPSRELVPTLESLVGRPPDDGMITTARQLFARVLDAPGRLKVQTIHAFCESLLARFPLEAGIPPHFQVLDERSALEMLKSAQQEVFVAAHRPGGEALAAAIAAVTAQANEQVFTDLVAELIAERARLNRLIAGFDGLDGVIAALESALGVAGAGSAEDLLAAACADEALDLMGLRLAADALRRGTPTDQARGEAIAAWLEAAPAARPASFQAYLSAFLKEGGNGEPYKKLINKDALAAAPGTDTILTAEAERLAQARGRLHARAVADATAALLRLGHEILRAYGGHKRRRGLLDYDDLILETRNLLRRPGVAAWVLYKLDGGLDHILIDEAQDTNPEQWDVIRALSEEFFAGEGTRDTARTVFAVGDAKQSIFSFQRADPAAFSAMRDHFASAALAARQRWNRVDLTVSFRSTAAVLQAVDCVFADEEVRAGLLFGESALRHDPVRVGQAGLVELWPPADPLPAEEPAPWEPPRGRTGALDPRTRLARLIARRIWHWTRAEAGAGDPAAWLAAKDRRLRPGDFLILVRRRNAFVEELVRELKQLDVPVAGVDRMVLTEQLAVMDLVALGRCLLLPEDDLTLATVLKGPLVGLDEDELFALAHGRAGRLWHELKRRAGAGGAFAAAYETLSALRARADFLRPFELYARVLGPGGGREALLARLGAEAADPIEEFLSLALAFEREQAPSLEGFLHWLEAGAQTVKRDMEHGGDAVRVMTVHGAKGLQAPVVFLPDTLQVPQAPRGLFWLEDGLALWPIRRALDGEAASDAREAAAAAQDREYRRLLYVAMTRAEDRLYVCGWNTRNKAPEKSWYRIVERALPAVAGSVTFDFTAETEGGWTGPGLRLETAQVAEPEAVEAVPARPPRQPPPAWLKRPVAAEPAPPRPLAPSRPAGEEPAVASPLGPDRSLGFRRGRLIHRLLQTLPDLPADGRAAAGRRFLASPVHGLGAEAQAEILAETLAVIEDPALGALFGPGSRAEVPIIGQVGDQVVSGQVDRLVVAEQAVRVIDYKTSRPAPETEAGVPALYLRQMAAYRAILGRLYADRPIESFLLWTEGPRILQLSDDLLVEHAP